MYGRYSDLMISTLQKKSGNSEKKKKKKNKKNLAPLRTISKIVRKGQTQRHNTRPQQKVACTAERNGLLVDVAYNRDAANAMRPDTVIGK